MRMKRGREHTKSSNSQAASCAPKMSLAASSENVAANSCEGAPRAMRKMRKGTRSCTECRRRKVRCIFLPGNPDVCSRCGSRGLKCIDQRFAGVDKSAEDEKKTLRDRVTRLEALLESALGSDSKEVLFQAEEENHESDQYSISSGDSDDGFSMQHEAPLMAALNSTMKTFSVNGDSAITTPSEQLDSNLTNNSISGSQGLHAHENTALNRDQKTCARLLAALPPFDELRPKIATKGQWWKSWRQKTFGPTDGAELLSEFAARAYPSQNVLELALLVLAYARTVEKQYSRYLHLVERLVISKDEYASKVQGLECIILQAKCHLDFGQPRRAWLTYRRGLMLAQLTNFHKTHTRSLKSAAIWWSLYHGDRFCSLLLGLPHSTHDLPSPATQRELPREEDVATTTHRLMQRSGEIAGSVILLHQAPTAPQLSSILHLDEQLDDIAASMPPSWWDTQLPSPGSRAAESELRSRMLIHAYFFHVRMYLHLPLLLEPAASKRALLSQKSCLEAARMLLHRCTLLRANTSTMGSDPNDVLFECKTNDFVGFTAAIVLLISLANDSGSELTRKTEDWATLERTRDFFLRLHALRDCKVAHRCYKALDILIKSIDGAGTHAPGTPTKVFVPYFGNVCIKVKVPAAVSHSYPTATASVSSGSTFQHSQPANTSFAPTPTSSGPESAMNFADTLENFHNFDGFEAFLQNPGPMFGGAEHGMEALNDVDMGMSVQWWNERLLDIDGDWEMLQGERS